MRITLSIMPNKFSCHVCSFFRPCSSFIYPCKLRATDAKYINWVVGNKNDSVPLNNKMTMAVIWLWGRLHGTFTEK